MVSNPEINSNVKREREREMYFNSDTIHTETNSDNTALHALKFTGNKN